MRGGRKPTRHPSCIDRGSHAPIPVSQDERFPVFTLTKKRTTAILAILGAVAAASAAIAYWTAGGSGTGSATTGTNVALTAVQTSTITNMYPGDTVQTLSGNFTNPNPSLSYVATVTASIASVTKATLAVAGICDAGDYTLANAAMTVNAQVPAGSAQGVWTGATIKFNNKGTNQDQCKGATVNLAYAIA